MNRLVIIGASLPLVGILVFYLTQGSSPASKPQKSSTTATAVAAPAQNAPQAPQSQAKGAKPSLTAEERRQKEEAILAKMRQLTTPEQAQKFVNMAMERREPGYAALFEAWQLDANTAQKIRQLIRERDMEQELWILKPEATNGKTALASSEEKRAQKYLRDGQIADLVGSARFKKLREVEDAAQAALERQAHD